MSPVQESTSIAGSFDVRTMELLPVCPRMAQAKTASIRTPMKPERCFIAILLPPRQELYSGKLSPTGHFYGPQAKGKLGKRQISYFSRAIEFFYHPADRAIALFLYRRK
jgi:hypothetical protein